MRFLFTHFQPAEDGGGSRFTAQGRGRVLESALTLHVLQQAGMESAWQQRLRGYLNSPPRGTDTFSGLLASAALGRAGPPHEVLGAVDALMGSLTFGQRRKQALLLMLLVELGLLPLERAQVSPEDFAQRAAHRFSQLYGAGLRLLYGRHSGRPLAQAAQDIAFLESGQARNGSWEQQSLITLVAMMGLGPSHPAFHRGLAFLRRVERTGGGIAFINDLDVWFNAMMGLALQAAQQGLPEQRAVTRFLASRQHANGGWSFTDEMFQTDVDSTANCMQVLLQSGEVCFEPRIDHALSYLQRLEQDDGGYPTYERGGESEITMTANILLVQSLSLHRRPELWPTMRRTSRFLPDRQRSDGSFETSWSLCETYSLFRVLWALEHYQAVDKALQTGPVRPRALRYLLDHQNADGGWGQTGACSSDVLSTAYALAALCVLRNQDPEVGARVATACTYLLGQQHSVTGELASIPDMLGPRPIAYDVPVLSTVHGVLALSLALEGSALHGPGAPRDV